MYDEDAILDAMKDNIVFDKGEKIDLN